MNTKNSILEQLKHKYTIKKKYTDTSLIMKIVIMCNYTKLHHIIFKIYDLEK